jgi:putative ABC transport system ATP-binding protein
MAYGNHGRRCGNAVRRHLTIRLRNVSKAFHAGRSIEHRAIDAVSLDIRLQEATVIKGPSGSGKTTLLGLIGCMARPTSGRIFLRERDITSLPERFLAHIRRDTFGFVFQQCNLIRGLTALENVMAPTLPTGERLSLLRERALAIMESLEVAGRQGIRIEFLSGGEAQRVAIARALMNDPAVVIADEPTAHLDTALSRQFLDIMGRLKGRGTTLIFASHDPIVCEWQLADRVVEMRDGRIIDDRSMR